MRLRNRLMMIAIIPLILSTVIIGYMISQILELQSSSKEDVEVLLQIETLNGEFVSARQSLASAAVTGTGANKQEAAGMLGKIEKDMKQLKSAISEANQKATFTKAENKFSILTKEAGDALKSGNQPEIKRQSIRIAGIMNDLYLLDKQAEEWYEAKTFQMEKQINFIVTSSLIASILLILLSGGFSWLAARKITMPLNEIVQQAGRVARGDLTIEIQKAKPSSKFEIDLLRSAFADMIGNVKSTVESIDDVGKQVSTFSKEVSGYMESVTESSSQVAVSTEELAKGSQAISEDIQSTAELMRSMGDNFTVVQQESQNSLKASMEAMSSIDAGRKSLEKQAGFAGQLSSSSEGIKASVQEFADYTGKIENAAHTVREIAEQTNLLALNAAIEAGKGFAVVAEEVRKLADDSSKATVLITSMVSSIKQGVSTILNATELGSKLTDEQLGSIKETEDSFFTIAGHVAGIYDQLTTLAEGTEKSASMSQQVIAAIENVSAVTEETAAGTEEISASTDAQLRSFEQVGDKVSALEALTEEMKRELGKFKVS
ncbi:methyl-accepting chemotaxis protein [Bacillus sp. UMB0728]|uniref:methyl-accepting chemotaxis protein n=1 Tax=Bacillus sp. UMB0728 TaxID=2066052 RepID=UPI000C7715A5|nr:methyl-accepting chemotaxis protein [Bacillus sp. UMB0728]PLR73729.1 methyl-accepting chemotaxis protein [Bacillus sp. UMB0728]